jgi:hypothetical protein
MTRDDRAGARVSCPSAEVLPAFGLGYHLPEAQDAPVAEHIESCPDCEAALDRVAEAGDSVMAVLRRLEEKSTVQQPPARSALSSARAHPAVPSGPL